MAGVMDPVEWQKSAEDRYERYRSEPDVERRKRLQALWRLRQGESQAEAARQAGIGQRTRVRWLAWYRSGGLAEVRRRVPGHAARGKPCRLSPAQKEEVVERCAQGKFRTTRQGRDWVENAWGVGDRESGRYSVLARLEIHPQVPRPQAEKADPEAQEAWKTGDVPAP